MKKRVSYDSAPGKTRKSVNAAAFLFLAATICIQVTAGGCVKKGDASPPSIIGRWQNSGFPVERPVITFKNDGTYLLDFQEGKYVYNGIFTATGSHVRVTDLYCGKALKGEYKYSILDTMITFKVVSDSFCDRNRFFSVPWVRKN